ncbi:hypothetical protein N7451_002250 [Penicillium sp. IBT 35674x]|nr:hypothetical protein N7451_002250 [Penicillium sp. IBT 35674x]
MAELGNDLTIPEYSEHRWASNQVQYASDSRIRKAAKLAAVIGSSSSLLVPIIILYFVKPQSSRLICITLFTLSFSAFLAIFTKVKSSEIFGATAAYVDGIYNMDSAF